MMRMLLRVLALTALAACSASVTTTDGAPATNLVSSEGQLTLTVSDAPARPGFLFVAGTVTGGQGVVTVASTRYGSTCATSVTAHADVETGKITLLVKYSERLTICTAEIRALTYRADIGGLVPGAYDVTVVHTNADGKSATVLTQRVKVT